MASSEPISAHSSAGIGDHDHSPRSTTLPARQQDQKLAEAVNMSAFKRDHHGNEKKHHDSGHKKPTGQHKTVPVVRNAYTPMFERFRDELDEHHERKERIVKASRDVTALSKKM
jgi:hypothetical protein